MKLHKVLVATVLVLGASSIAGAVTFPQCAATGAATGCNALITLNADGSATVSLDSTQQPYDGSEDSLIGVLNNTTKIITSLPISSASDIFGLDGDGMCSGFSPSPAGNCKAGITGNDPYDYTGDFVTFTITDVFHGVVNFTGGLAPGASTYFSLEDTPTSLGLVTGPPSGSTGPSSSTPEPASFLLLAGGLGAFALLKRR